MRGLFNRFGLGAYRSDVYQAHKELTGRKELTLSAFREVFSSFPIRLRVCRIEAKLMSKLLTWANLSKGLASSQLLTEFADARDELGDDEDWGVVMPWPKFPNGMVMHSSHRLAGFPGCRVVLNFESSSDGVSVFLESFNQLCGSIKASGWAP